MCDEWGMYFVWVVHVVMCVVDGVCVLYVMSDVCYECCIVFNVWCV